MKKISFGTDSPTVTIIGGIHGDEPSGKIIVNMLRDYLSDKNLLGTVNLIIANEKALKKDKRYIETDVNRSFPGDKNSNIYEERLAARILNEISSSHAVLALHSTNSSPPPFAIYSRNTEVNRKSIGSMSVDYAIDCSEVQENTLDEYFQDAITLECGLQHSESAIEFGFEASKEFLKGHNIINENTKISETKIIKAIEEIPKGKGQPRLHCSNFEEIEPNKVFAEDDIYKHKTDKQGLVPVLASENGYENIFGLLGKYKGKLSNISD